jgi:HEAT repeat protein
MAAAAAPDGGAMTDNFWLGLLRQATAEAFHAVVVQVDARKRGVIGLQDDLASKDVAVRQEAVRELGRRGEVAALDAIAGLLDDPHQDVVLASVGALTNLRDQRAATSLIASTRGRSTEYLAAVIGALRTIAGLEAEAYLDALATGHPSDHIKARATQALLDVRARRYSPRRGKR